MRLPPRLTRGTLVRGEREILDLIRSTAENDDRIRAAIMTGSRADPGAPRDVFQDFDVVYVVTEVAPFVDDPAWIRRFGELMILQTPETMRDPPPASDGGFAYLMQLADGNRIDLTLFPIDRLHEREHDSLSVLLLDKDGLFPPFPPPSDADHLPKPPTARAFSDCCNEFWWTCPYVAKGLWRREMPYAMHALDRFVREQLMKMLSWHVGMNTGFTRGPGKFGRHLKRCLEPELWEMLLKTYSDASYENTWEALFAACELFRATATRVAEHFGFAYPHGDDARVSAHLRHVRRLPGNATEMY